MSAQQLHLFPPDRPLVERFGEDFFRAVPRSPGVYIMSGEGDRILYIGQSGNLRQRLGAYKNARPDRAPRKIIRLVHQVRTLVWEQCDSREQARLREAQLLRLHRPKFNVMNTYPAAYRFISLRAAAEQLEFRIGGEPLVDHSNFGAFKTGAIRAVGSLLRLLWAALHRPASPHEFPALLLRERAPREFVLRARCGADADWKTFAEAIEPFLGGENDAVVEHLRSHLTGSAAGTAFQDAMFANDLEILTSFFEFGARRNRNLRTRHGIEGAVIPQATLDDLLALELRT